MSYESCALFEYFQIMTHVWVIHMHVTYFTTSNFIWITMVKKKFEIRPRKFFNPLVSQNAWAESKFWLKNRNQHKIPRRMIYDDPRFNPPVYEFSCSLRFHAYAISFWLETSPKVIQNIGSSYIIRRGILCWFWFFSQNFDSAHAFWETSRLKNLRGRISKIFPPL